MGQSFLCPLHSFLKLYKLFIACLATSALLLGQAAVTTQHNDLNRSGAILNETILNTSNVNVNTFGKLFSRAVDGQIYAQPLYVPNLLIPGQGVHNVVYICTENDSVYAFDADLPGAANPLWQVSLGTALPASVIGATDNLIPQIGVSGTPTIDLSSNTLYVVAETYEHGTEVFRLHALDITTGAEKLSGPVVISGSVSTSTGTLAFSPNLHWQRPGLLLLNDTVYIGFGSHLDASSFHGWVIGYNATTLQQTAIRCITPNALEGGVWQGGAGLVADADGFMYVQTGNGTMDANTGGSDYADSIVKLDTNNALTVVDYFSPSNQLSLAGGDVDFGAGGPILIPGTSSIVGGGKDGKLFLLNTANLGHFNIVDQSVQEWQATYSLITNGSGGFFGGNAFYNSTLYVWGRRDVLKAWSFNGSTFNTTPTLGPDVVPDDYSNEPGLSISANGTAAGSGILWAFHSAVAGGADGQPHAGVLRAFDASNIANELWNSNQNQTRDYSGSWAKWDPPTVANGKVYLATFDNVVNVFGLLSGNSSGHLLGNGNSSSAAVNLTTEGDSDWEHWGTDGLNRKSGVTAQLSTYTLVGSGNASAYTGDPRPLGWSDGTPARTNASDPDGVQVSGIGNGFSIVAPADTVIRTLVIHAGGQNSGGSLTAHLSDGSAADFRDTTTTASGRYDRNYTFTYGAAAEGQTLTVKWTMLSGTGNVTLSAATLGGSTITASGGTPQSAHVNLAFASALQATVKDAGGNPINGAAVTFTLPDSGASGTFGGSNIVTTNSSGIATAPTLTANAIAGPYNVSASLAGLAGSANFSLTNLAPLGSGTLSGSGNSSSGTVNLTAEGTVDWEHWGDTNLNHKNGVTPVLSTYAEVGNGSLLSYPNDLRPISWTDGTPAATATNDTNGVYVQGIGKGFSLTAPADGSSRTLVVHVGGWNSGATLTAHLSDGSAADFTDTTATASGIYDRNYTLTYSASGPGQSLKVTWVMVSGSGNVNICAAALGSASGSITATAGTPQSTTVSSNFATALQATVKDSSGDPVSGVSVIFTAPGTGPSGTFSGSVTASRNTNSSGVATAPTLTANSQAGGPYSVTAMVSGVATEADFSLTNTGGTPASIATTAGTPQSATVSTNFATALRATVKDSIGNPVGGVSVTFTAPPGTGPSGTFSGSATASSTTNSSGLAIAPTLTANNLAGGPYTVTATVAGVATPANFSLTNTAGTTGGGSLVGSGNSLATLMNLTSEGATDWEHWGDASLNRKKGVTAQLSTYTVVGTKGVLVYDNDLRPIAWNDGTPTAGAVGDTNGIYIPGLGQGFSFTAPADTTTRTLVVHVGGWNSGGTFTASLSDGSAGDFTDTTAVNDGQYDRNYTLTYSAGSPSQTLTITWTMTSGTGNVTLNGAALGSASGSITASAGTSQSATINTAFATALQATVKDSSGTPAGGVSVTFTAPGTGPSGTFSGLVTASSNTNSSGVATAPTLTANSQVGGPYTVTATVSGVATAANFSLTNTGGTPASITTTAGTPQSAAVSSNFATALQATVKDSSGNPVGGVSVTFTAPGTGPSGTFSGSVTASRNTNSSGVATAPTLTANSQAGGPYTVTAAVVGVATAANFRLTNTAGTPASITTTAGTPQSATVRTNFATALQATVKDSSGNPVGGVSVTFTAPPGTGPSGTFSGTATASSNTNSSGVATAPTLTANSLAGGPYTVTATVAGVATPANFRLTNTAGTTGGGSLVGSGNSLATLMNLTSEGTTDWEHWGDSSLNRKKGVTAQLSTYTVVGTKGVLVYDNDLRPIAWNDGTPTANAVGDTNGIYIPGLGQGFLFTAPADTTTRTLVVHVGGWNSGGTFTASLSDGSAGDFTDVTATNDGQYDRNYTLTYSAGSASQTLTITWKMTSGIGNVTLNGAALSGGSSGGSEGSLTGAGNSSQSLIDLTSEGPTDWEHWGDSSLNHKAGVTAQLSIYTVVGTKGVVEYSNDLRPTAWSDGTPTASAVSDTNGIYIQGLGQGFSFTAPADTTTRTLVVHVGGWNSGGTFTASLSDGSAGDFTDVTATNDGQYDRNYTLTYSAGSASQTLTITWTMTSGVGNVTLNAAALQ